MRGAEGPRATPGHLQGRQEQALIQASLLSGQYLGLVEVEESRGMHVCEDAVKKLKVVSVHHRGLGLG